MAKNSKPKGDKLSLIARLFGRKKAALSLDDLVSAMISKNEKLVRKLEQQVNELDPFSFPASAKNAKYRWERLSKDLLEQNDKLRYLLDRMKSKRAQTVVNMFTYEFWPLTLRISSRHEIETGDQGDWIEDTSALYVLCEELAAREEPAVTRDSEILLIFERQSDGDTVLGSDGTQGVQGEFSDDEKAS